MNYEPEYDVGLEVEVKPYHQSTQRHDIQILNTCASIKLLRFDHSDNTWLVDAVHDDGRDGQYWIVQNDIVGEVINEVALDKEVRQLLGIDPKPHCTTCICYQD